MKAVYKGVTIADSDDTIVVEGNHYFPPDSIRWSTCRRRAPIASARGRGSRATTTSAWTAAMTAAPPGHIVSRFRGSARSATTSRSVAQCASSREWRRPRPSSPVTYPPT